MKTSSHPPLPAARGSARCGGLPRQGVDRLGSPPRCREHIHVDGEIDRTIKRDSIREREGALPEDQEQIHIAADAKTAPSKGAEKHHRKDFFSLPTGGDEAIQGLLDRNPIDRVDDHRTEGFPPNSGKAGPLVVPIFQGMACMAQIRLRLNPPIPGPIHSACGTSSEWSDHILSLPNEDGDTRRCFAGVSQNRSPTKLGDTPRGPRWNAWTPGSRDEEACPYISRKEASE